MEETNIPEATKPGGCINCSNPIVVKGYPNPLCESCREKLVKFPIPLWIKLFAAGIGLIFLFSLYKIPKNIGLGIHLEKGKTALAEKRYLTAQRELQKVVDKVPDNIEAQGHLLIAAFYNQDFETVKKVYENIKGENIEDQELFGKINNTLQKTESYFGDQSFDALQHKYAYDLSKIPDNELKQYVDSNSNSIYAAVVYASRLFEKKEYEGCDSVLKKVVQTEPDCFPALCILASSTRIENKFDESMNYCDKILSFNKESVYGFATKSRTLLMEHKDAEALDMALKSTSLDENDAYALGTLLLVYHFTNKSKEKETLMKKISMIKDSSSIETLSYVNDVISGKEFFRK